MIRSFRHRGLEIFFNTGSKAGIQPAHAKKLAHQLTVLNIARRAQEVDLPGWQLHPLGGNLQDHWSIKVNGNWRLTFCFAGENAILLDYQDYH